ncbi:MAG: hypothetical protein GY822_28760 [Deltaproteobacteria bacterium]|nr:hypothetical protein [Deltaproteobacteria bacterium]
MQRRDVLKRGLLGGALLTFGSSAYLGTRSGKIVVPADAAVLGVFDAHAYSVMVAVCETVLPPGANVKRAAYNVDQSLLNAPARTHRDLTEALHLLDNSLVGFFTRGSLKVFTEMSFGDENPQRQQALLSWRNSKLTLLRGAYHSLRRLAFAGHYAENDNTKIIHYPGPPFEKTDPGPILARAPLSPPWQPTPAVIFDDVKPVSLGETP